MNENILFLYELHLCDLSKGLLGSVKVGSKTFTTEDVQTTLGQNTFIKAMIVHYNKKKRYPSTSLKKHLDFLKRSIAAFDHLRTRLETLQAKYSARLDFYQYIKYKKGPSTTLKSILDNYTDAMAKLASLPRTPEVFDLMCEQLENSYNALDEYDKLKEKPIKFRSKKKPLAMYERYIAKIRSLEESWGGRKLTDEILAIQNGPANE